MLKWCCLTIIFFALHLINLTKRVLLGRLFRFGLSWPRCGALIYCKYVKPIFLPLQMRWHERLWIKVWVTLIKSVGSVGIWSNSHLIRLWLWLSLIVLASADQFHLQLVRTIVWCQFSTMQLHRWTANESSWLDEPSHLEYYLRLFLVLLKSLSLLAALLEAALLHL